MQASFRTIVPTKFHTGILALCRKIGTGSAPTYVDVAPDRDSILNDCFRNVQNRIARDGGTQQCGWILWEAENILIEAEFHCVWRTPQDKLLCISAREDGENRLAFLPDHSRRHEGRRVENIALSWPNNQSVEELLAKEAELFKFEERHVDPTTGCIRCSKKERDHFLREIELAARKYHTEQAQLTNRE